MKRLYLRCQSVDDQGEVFARVRAEPALQAAAPTDDALFEDFREIYEILNAIERLLLRRPSRT
jgi:hypothetical protein